MRILLTGATGLIGSAVATRLMSDGHQVTGVARNVDEARKRLSVTHWIRQDLRDIRGPNDWTPHLVGIDAVVNCAGALQDSPRDSVRSTHADAPCRLWEACWTSGIRRVIQISAAGVDRNPDTVFMKTKLIADQALMASNLDWTILRPTLVLGRGAYGGSALLRGLASLPVSLRIPSAGRFDHVAVGDVAETVSWALRSDDAVARTFELAGGRSLAFEELIAAYRSWLGFRPAHAIALPSWVMAMGFKLGDAASLLGWRPPMRTTAWRETMRGTTGDGSRWQAAAGIVPDDLNAMLAREPATVQERWFARLYLLKAVGIASFSLFWIATALIAAGPGRAEGLASMTATGIPAPEITTWLTISADAIVGALIACRSTARTGLRLSLVLTGIYAASATILEANLWLDPLGPLVKLIPVIVLNLMLLAIMEER